MKKLCVHPVLSIYSEIGKRFLWWCLWLLIC